jgi:hypothetical protein
MATADKHYSMLLLLFSLLIFFSGCISIPGKNGTKHYLIVGLGIVSVNDSQIPAVIATDAHTLGISISDQPGLKLAVGYSSSTVVSIPDEADDVRVEVSKIPGSPIVIDVPSARLMKNRVPRGETEDEKHR